MRIPYSWLIEVLRVGAPEFAATPASIEETLIRIGHEVEEVIVPGPVTGPLVIGRVAQITELTDFKKPIRFCLVDVGEAEPREIVCGASNFAVNDLVVVALPGVTLPGDFTIATRKTYGHTSDGMICSTTELGLGSDSSGILVLPPGTADPGADAAEVVGLDDVIFDLSITPDRGYCLSVRGLARDLACAYDLDFADPAAVESLPADKPSLPVHIDTGTGVKRFGLRPVIGIDPAAVSPWWLQRRLMLCGIRAISPAVDATNYVMLEIGHPMHAHDKARISGDFRVRFATPGETVITLDDVQRKLEPGDVLIADDAGVTAIGGVMGAGSTEMREDSTDVLLEAAVWDPAAVLRTQRRLHLHSEAGRRYDVPTTGTSAHAFTLLHDDERAAFTAQVDSLGKDTTLLVDTYDVKNAVKIAVEVAGPELGGVRLDSGDLLVQAREVREQLDSLGATSTKIVVTSDLDEYAIAALAAGPVDAYGVGTSLVTGSGAPTAGMVYKLVQHASDDGQMIDVAKKSKDKISVGGRKWALRRRNAQGVAEAEIIGIGEQPVDDGDDRALLVPLVRNGEVVAPTDAASARAVYERSRAELPAKARQMSRGEPVIPTRYEGPVLGGVTQR